MKRTLFLSIVIASLLFSSTVLSAPPVAPEVSGNPNQVPPTGDAPAATQTKGLNLGFGQDGLGGKAAQSAGYNVAGTDETTVAQIVGMIIQGALAFLGVVFTVLLVMGGYNWMTARGDESKVEKATGTIRTGIIGIIIILGSYSLATFVINAILAAPAATP